MCDGMMVTLWDGGIELGEVIFGSMSSGCTIGCPLFGMKKGSLESNGPMGGIGLPNKGCT